MSESTVDYTQLPVLLRMGLCRDKDCKIFDSHGPAGCICPGNNKYFTRGSCRKFDVLRTRREQLRSSTVEHSQNIGFCAGNTCFRVGYPGMVCMKCSKDGVYNTFVPIAEQSYTSVYIRHYLADNEDEKCRMLKKVNSIDEYSTFALIYSTEVVDTSYESYGVADTSFEPTIED